MHKLSLCSMTEYHSHHEFLLIISLVSMLSLHSNSQLRKLVDFCHYILMTTLYYTIKFMISLRLLECLNSHSLFSGAQNSKHNIQWDPNFKSWRSVFRYKYFKVMAVFHVGKLIKYCLMQPQFLIMLRLLVKQFTAFYTYI